MAERPTPEIVDAVARVISGAPFPSQSSYRKARAAIKAVRDHLARDGISAIIACDDRKPKKRPGERDTEFVKRLAVGMIDAAMGDKVIAFRALTAGDGPDG